MGADKVRDACTMGKLWNQPMARKNDAGPDAVFAFFVVLLLAVSLRCIKPIDGFVLIFGCFFSFCQ